MFKHIVDGGSWIDGDDWVRAAYGVERFRHDHPNFRQQYFGHDHEFQDNNKPFRQLKVCVAGFFRDKTTRKYYVGHITKAEKPRGTPVETVSLDLLDILRGPPIDNG